MAIKILAASNPLNLPIEPKIRCKGSKGGSFAESKLKVPSSDTSSRHKNVMLRVKIILSRRRW